MPTAAEAAAANLAWRAVNAPSTIQSSEQQQAAQYRQQYYTIEQPAQQARDAAIQQTIIQNRQMINRQEGLEYAGTHTQAQLAALSGSADVGRQAYEQERSYYESAPSSEFQRLTGQYAASRNQIVTGNMVYAATGELRLSDPSEEASGPVYSGRASQYKSAIEREVWGIGAPDNEREYYRRQAEREAVGRPGYTAPKELGDIRTQQIRQGYGMFSQAVGLADGEIASDYQMTGRLLETRRQEAYDTPTRRDERFFMGEIQKWAEIPVEKSASYHDIGMRSGKAIPANPYEYQADLAVEFLKGSPDKSSEFFSPVSGEMSRHLPGGQGVQEYAWDEAITDYKRQTGAANTPYPERVSFMEGVTYLGAAEGKYGPYGKLYGGVDNGGVDSSGGRLKGSGMVGGAGASEGGFGGAVPATSVTIEKQSGALPFIGEVPFISPMLSNFMPMQEVTRTKITKYSPDTTEVMAPYTIYGVTYTETVTTKNTLTETTESRKDLQTPFTMAFQERMPETNVMKTGLRVAGLSNPFMAGSNIGMMVADTGAKAIRSVSPHFASGIETNIKWGEKIEGTSYVPAYTAIREDPAIAGISYAGGFIFGGAGGILRSAGVGTKYLAEGSKAGGYYQTFSKVASVSMGAIYANDLSVRATGLSLGEWQRPNVLNIQSKWKGVENVADVAGAASVREIGPFVVGMGGGRRIGDFVSQRVQTRGMKEIQNPQEFSYTTEEGYPTHNQITTKDLRNSFNQGTLKVNANILEGTMQPSGKPLTRVPVEPQRDVGAIFGETHVYSGQPNYRLAGGYVTPGGSEIPGLFVSPVGDTYFTKAGLGQGGGGIGMTGDILGIYRNPIMYRPTLKQGDMVEIPQSVLSTHTRGISANDPLNPRNIAIDTWAESNVKFGKMMYGQYGKSEWQGIFRSGSEVITKPVGYYVDVPTGSRIVLSDVSFTGKGVATPRPKTINPTTGKQVYEVGRNYMGGSSSVSGYRKSLPPLASSVFGTSKTTSKTFSEPSISKSSSIISSRIAGSRISSSGFSKSTSIPGYSSRYGSSRSAPGSSSITSKGSSQASSKISSSMSYPSSRFVSLSSSIKIPSSSSKYDSTRTPSFASVTGSSTSGSENGSSTSGGSSWVTGSDITKTPDTTLAGGFLPGGGGGSGYRGNLGITRWQRENLVADMPYLTKGMREFGMGWDAGTYRESTKWFSTGKKKSKRRKK